MGYHILTLKSDSFLPTLDYAAQTTFNLRLGEIFHLLGSMCYLHTRLFSKKKLIRENEAQMVKFLSKS